jgi:hypothetical protein
VELVPGPGLLVALLFFLQPTRPSVIAERSSPAPASRRALDSSASRWNGLPTRRQVRDPGHDDAHNGATMAKGVDIL